MKHLRESWNKPPYTPRNVTFCTLIYHTILNGKFFRTNLCLTEFRTCHLDWSTYFIWRNDIIISSVTSQFPEKYFRQNELCKMSSEYAEIKYISYTTVLWFSEKFIPLFVPESFSMIILSYPFSKVLFSPTFLHRFSFRKKTGGLAEHDFVLYLQNVYFPT